MSRLRRDGWLELKPFVLFALGDYLAGVILTGMFLFHLSFIGVIVEAILAAVFIYGMTVVIWSKEAPNG